EYNEVIRDIFEKHRRTPKVVVYAVNMANDLFETHRPNRERHKVWDGWAVRAETAPRKVAGFPGREFLLRHSHLIYALRRLFHSQPAEVVAQGFPSEGGWQDLVAEGTGASAKRLEAEKAAQAARSERVTKVAELQKSLAETNERLDDAVYERFPELRSS